LRDDGFIRMKVYIFLKKERVDSFYKHNIFFLRDNGDFYKNKTKYLMKNIFLKRELMVVIKKM